MRLFRNTAATLAIALVVGSVPALADEHDIAQAVEADYDSYLEPLFIHFHQNPELSFLETDTAKRMAADKRMAAELSAVGIEVTENVGGTGVVGMLRNGEGPLILLRADMDGLPVPEKSGLEYASTATQVGQDGKEYHLDGRHRAAAYGDEASMERYGDVCRPARRRARWRSQGND